MGFMSPCLETNILPTWQERGEKKNILSTELLLDAQGRELWRNLSGSLSSTHGWPSPAGRRRGREEWRRGPAGGKMGFIRGKKDRERRRQCAAEKQPRHDFLIGRGTFEWNDGKTGNYSRGEMCQTGCEASPLRDEQIVLPKVSVWVRRLVFAKGAKVRRWTTTSDDQRCQKYGYLCKKDTLVKVK